MLGRFDPPLISDDFLTDLATPDSRTGMGEFDADTRAMLAIALPEMASELLARRAADRNTAPRPAENELAVARARRLDAARRAIRAAGPISAAELANACRILLAHSTKADERQAAAEILSQLRAVA